MILSAAGAELSYTQGFVPVGVGNAWAAKPGGVGAVNSSLTDATNLTIDWSTGTYFPITMTTNTTFTFINATIGQRIKLILTQNGTGSNTGTFSQAIFSGGSKTLSTTANAVDTVEVEYTGSLYLANLLKAYA